MANRPFITAANAAELALKSQEARKNNKLLAAADLLDPAAESIEGEKHRKLRLVRVRLQQAKLDSLIEGETDAGKLDRLASAAMRLNEQERQLSNRSLPPTLKAPAPRSKRSPQDYTPE